MRKSYYPGGKNCASYREAKADYVMGLMKNGKCSPDLALAFWHTDTHYDDALHKLQNLASSDIATMRLAYAKVVAANNGYTI